MGRSVFSVAGCHWRLVRQCRELQQHNSKPDQGFVTGRSVFSFRTIAIFAAAFLLQCVVASTAEAGFLDATETLSSFDSESGCGPISPSCDEELETPLNRFVDWIIPQSALVDPGSLPSSGGGMSSQSVPGSPPIPPALCEMHLQRDHSPNTFWGTLVEKSLSLPSPLATRLFRPPRI
jgi:hypothetical protein